LIRNFKPVNAARRKQDRGTAAGGLTLTEE
jgi:hypothetical protein